MASDVDTKTLEKLAAKLKEDANSLNGLSPAGMRSVAAIIEDSIGAPLMWPSRDAGANAAMDIYPGANDLRHAFNWGVKWAVENYQPSVDIKKRYG